MPFDNNAMHGVMEHLHEAKEHFPVENIVGVFLQGSQNYDMQVPESDVDTKLIVLPTLKSIVKNSKPISTTHLRANQEHIDFKDVRLYMGEFRKQNTNFIEILFTPYFWVNPRYAATWARLVENREKIARYDPYTNVKATQGIAKQKFFALEHPYPSKVEILAKFSYDPKQLHHLVRMEDLMMKYIAGESYEKCLQPSDRDYLLFLKKGGLSLNDARAEAQRALDHVDEMTHEFCNTHERSKDKETEELLNGVQYDLIESSLRYELLQQDKGDD